MTTVVDPAGTAEIIYNRSGTVVIAITTQRGDPAATIAHFSGHTVCLVTVTGNGGLGPAYVELPGDADIGDIVEVYVVQPENNTDTVNVNPPAGEEINNRGEVEVSTVRGQLFRKCSATAWFNR